MLKACGTWAYISSSWVVINLLRSTKLPLITTCKVPGTVGPLEVFILMFYTSQWFFLGVGLVRDPLLLSLAQTLPWKLVGTNCHLKDGAFLDPKPSRSPPMIQVCPLKSPALQDLGENCDTTNLLATSGALSCLPCYFLGPPCECVLFISFLCLNIKQLGKSYAKDLKVEIICTELQWKGRVWRRQLFTLLSLLSGGTRTGSASHWCGIGFRWHEAAGSCIGFLQCQASVTLLTPGSSGKRTWLVFLALTCCDIFFHQEDLPSNPIRVPRSHPQWSWCVLRLLGCQRIQSPSSHPKWTFQSQKGGNNLHVPIISNLGIWTC